MGHTLKIIITFTMTYFLLAGEASGDLHGAHLIKTLKKKDEAAVFHCWGGDLMEKAGALVHLHYNSLSFMGFWEVVKHIPDIWKHFQLLKQQLTLIQPDVLILIDYGGFNLRVAKYAYKARLKVIWYIAPKVWAWNRKRATKLRKYCDRIMVILPFEVKWFQIYYQMQVDYVGNPLLDAIVQKYGDLSIIKKQKKAISYTHKPIIALLPGSRKQEIIAHLPLFLQLIPLFPQLQFVLAAAPSLPFSFYTSFTMDYPTLQIRYNQTYEILQEATAAIVTSGTATLETALFNVPQVVCYRTSWLSYTIGKKLIQVSYISLVNLILEREAIKELIQDDCRLDHLCWELKQLLPQGKKRAKILADYTKLHGLLGEVGASERAARIVWEEVQFVATKAY